MSSMIVGYMMALGNGWHVECVSCAESNDTPATTHHTPIYDTSVPHYNYQTCHECGCMMVVATPPCPEAPICELHPNPTLIYEPLSSEFDIDEPFMEEPDPFASAMEQFNRPTDPAPPLIIEEYIDTLPAMKVAEPISGMEGIEW